MTCFFDKMQHDMLQHMIKMRCNNFRPSAAEILLTATTQRRITLTPTRVCVAWLSRNGVPAAALSAGAREDGKPSRKVFEPLPGSLTGYDSPGGRGVNGQTLPCRIFTCLSALCYCTESPIRNRHITSTGKLYRTCECAGAMRSHRMTLTTPSPLHISSSSYPDGTRGGSHSGPHPSLTVAPVRERVGTCRGCGWTRGSGGF